MDPELLDRLGDDARAAGYDTTGVLDLLGDPAHRALARGEKVAALRATTDDAPLSTLVRLFLLGRSVSERALAAALPRTGVAGALALGVVERSGDQLRAALDIRPHAADHIEFLVVSDLDSDVRPGPVRPDHVLGIGSASLSLARATVRESVGTVLDIGVGCGIQALHCAGHADHVTGTDTSPRALRLAAATARLSGQRWELLAGSLFEPVDPRRFDLIVSNPPFVMSAGEQRYSYRDSGVAGDGLVRRLVAGLADHLNPGGTAQLLANWIVRENTDWRERVGSWVQATGMDGWVVQRELADPVEYVALWLADAGENGDERLAADWLDYFERERVERTRYGPDHAAQQRLVQPERDPGRVDRGRRRGHRSGGGGVPGPAALAGDRFGRGPAGGEVGAGRFRAPRAALAARAGRLVAGLPAAAAAGRSGCRASARRVDPGPARRLPR